MNGGVGREETGGKRKERRIKARRGRVKEKK